MNKNLDVITYAVSLIIKAAILAARFSGRVRRRSLKRFVAMDTDAKAKEILFLKDRVYQLEMQVSILHRDTGHCLLALDKHTVFLKTVSAFHSSTLYLSAFACLNYC
ncbi:hypothetical protein MUP79_03635 [Candidatus Bathyarchaeota archaeon]|nr:hypothetical protein [Candidatus Bathyarchaeota archaeon]